MKKILIFLLMSLSLHAQEVFREGYIIKVEKPESVNVVERSGETNTLRPAKGKKFVAVHFVLREGRSLGKYDYILRAGDLVYRCKLIGTNTEVYNELNWEFHVLSSLNLRWKAEPVPALSGSRTVREGTGIRLLYEVDKKLSEATIIYNIAPVGLKPEEVSSYSVLTF